MNKVKFLAFAVIGLLVANILLIVFVLLNKPNNKKHLGPRNLIIEKLDFDKQQVLNYDKLIQNHRNEIEKCEREIMFLKNKLYSELTNENVTINDSLFNKIGDVQINIEKIHYKHFEDIKQLCHVNQKQKFDALTLEIASLFAPPPINGRKH